jgi:cytoskeletal protein CcmA (bactofilin family)
MSKENRITPYKSSGASSSSATAAETCIDKQAAVTGNIETKGSVCVDGKVNGDISAGGDLHVAGSVNGDVTAENMFLSGGTVIGNIAVRGEVKTDHAAEIRGNVSAKTLECNCKVEGNLDISAAAVLMEKALLIGDLTAATLRIENGASIRGRLQIQSSSSSSVESENPNPSPED